VRANPHIQQKRSIRQHTREDHCTGNINWKDLAQISKLPIESIIEDVFPQVSEDAPLSLISSFLQTYPALLISKKGNVNAIITKGTC
jgi:predicted transcriptional regulator